MIVSYKSLQQFVDLDGLTPEEVAQKLTFAGIEVESITHLGYGTNLVIGHILECEPHPDSDHLHVLKVDLGARYGVKQIVCGAPNARKGLKVIVAREGAVLPGGKIGHSIIRGVESEGMCCSLLELGVESKYLNEKQTSGIEELDESSPVGEERVLEYLGLDDTRLDLNVLANRPDLLSLINVAREVGAIFNRPIKEMYVEILQDFETDFKVGSKTSKCSQFSIKEIKDIKIKDSPKWMKQALMSMGVRSINNIVDIGNYVMLLTGQPLHMYDLDKLPERSLLAEDDLERPFIALDEKEYQLQKGDICICSHREPMCLGGIMGSLACAVDENSHNIVIEAASFDGASIRHTSNRLGLASESSMRFVKGTNHFQSEQVIDLAAYLIKTLCDGQHFSQTKVYQSEKYEEIVIKSSTERINGRLGTTFSNNEIKQTLERLYFRVNMKNDGSFTCAVPPFRLDVKEDADLSEEVIRLLGYEHIDARLPRFDTTVGRLSPVQEKISFLREMLLNRGLDECLTYSLISEKEAQCFNSFFKENPYRLLNPLTDDHVILRTNVIHSLLMSASYNVARQNKNLAFFETSLISDKSANTHHLAVCLLGECLEQDQLKRRPYDFYDAKGIVEAIMEVIGIDNSRYKFEKNTTVSELHPGKSALIVVQNKPIGFLGELHPKMKEFYDIGKNSAVVLEIVLDELLQLRTKEVKSTNISKFPSVSRDLALIVKDEVDALDLLRLIKSVGKGLVIDTHVFDVYKGENIERGYKSLAINITYCSFDHTLSDKEVTLVEDQIKFELNKRFGAILRA